jgi:hypothetical protein
MARSSNSERAQRINAALELMKECDSMAKAAAKLAEQFAISRSQALSVCAQSSDHGQRGSSSRPEDSFHHQIVAGSNSKNSAVRKLYRQQFKRYSIPGTGGPSPWHSWAWLRAENLQPEESSWNIVLIGCQTRRSSKLINFLYLQRIGQRVATLRIEVNLRKV